jgi:hypothetical protein
VPDRETIESTLERVRCGELSTDAATELLLAAELSEPSGNVDDYESLASLVSRLGTPPTEIVETWCRQMRTIARQHEKLSSEPLPAIELDQWSITLTGRLVWQQQTDQGCDATHPPSPTSLDRIDRFRGWMIPNQAPEPESPVSVASVIAVELPASALEPPSRRRGLIGPMTAGVLLVGGLLGVGLLVVGLLGAATVANWIIDRASQAELESMANIDTPAASPIGNEPSVDATPAESADETSDALETFESLSEAGSLSPESPALDLRLSFSLDQLIPPTGDSAGEPTAADSSDAQSERRQPTSDAVMSMLADDEHNDPPAESPQPTRTASTRAVALHSMDATIEATRLPLEQLKGLQLDFPFDAALSLRGDESNWLVHDTRSDTPIASITADADGPRLRWTEAAKRSPAALALFHGRITSQAGETVFLRPVIDADPWPLRLDKADVMPVWDLGFPIPPRATRIGVDFDLPEQIEEAWIEPIDAESLRRTRGIAVLSPQDGETVSLGIRFDVRCSRKLRCRVRYAGRLDPSMPWQLVSVPMLEQLANQLTDRAAAVSMESSRLERVYQMAGTADRRILRIKRDRTDTLAEMVSSTSQRVAQLQKLIAGLEAEGSVRIRVWVEWPKTEQDLLTMSGSGGEEEVGNGE